MAASYTAIRRKVREQVERDMKEIYGESCNHKNNVATCNVSNDCGSLYYDDKVYEDNNDTARDNFTAHGNSNQYDYDLDENFYFHSDSENESNMNSDHEEKDIVSSLAEWAVNFKVSLLAIGALLLLLRQYFPSLPKDPRTLLNTPRKHVIRKLASGGEYSHNWLEKGIRQVLQGCLLPDIDCFEIQFNTDGLPLFKSSRTSLWPILGMLKNNVIKTVFVIGVFCGQEKPSSAVEFFEDFVKETLSLLHNGLLINGKHFKLKIHSFVCDAPARAFVKGIKYHSGYNSCEKCVQVGHYVGKVIFPQLNDRLRTDISFNQMSDEDHHRSPYALKPLNIGGVTQFGLDFMHLGCLGVMRRSLLYWKRPIGPLNVRISSRNVSKLSDKLLSYVAYIPYEFARKPRALSEIMRWKATEFRLFLLYLGPFALDGVLPTNLLDHFLLLYVASRILTSSELSKNYTDFANNLLVDFVSKAANLYGQECLVYNVHSLVHIAQDVKRLGPLDEFSSFPYENMLGQLKKLIRKPQTPIQQLLRRLEEKQIFHNKQEDIKKIFPILTKEHFEGILITPGEFNVRQYLQFQTEYWFFKISEGNNCFIAKDGSVNLIRNITEKGSYINLICQSFSTVSDAFTFPLPSSRLSICKVLRNKLDSLKCCQITDIVSKCMCLPYSEDSCIIIPILH